MGANRNMDIEKLFDDLDDISAKPERIIKAPFMYPGGKGNSLKFILPYLPFKEGYIEPFGGSGAVLLNRSRSNLEVLNDRHAGITAFYRCMRDPVLLEKFIDWCEYTVNSREEWYNCKETWCDAKDDFSRATAWYYATIYSFVSKGSSWAYTLVGSGKHGISGKARNKIPLLKQMHARLKYVTIENRDWLELVKIYDHSSVVWYMDPPYYGNTSIDYKHNMKEKEHILLLDTIQTMDGYVAISGASNDLYDSYPWDDKITYEVIRSCAYKHGSESTAIRPKCEECLWIKYNQSE